MKRPLGIAISAIGLACAMLVAGCSSGSGGGSNPPPPQPPVIASVQPPAGTAGVAYPAFTFTATGGVPPLTWSESGALPGGMMFSDTGILSGTPTAPGSFSFTVMVQDSGGRNAAPLDCTIQISGVAEDLNMETPRTIHTATLLTNGSVLVAGGNDNDNNALASAELFDANASTFSPTGSMAEARAGHVAIPLAGGKVLVAGGLNGNTVLASAELFDPSSGEFSPSSSMNAARFEHTGTLLQDGTVLVTGGQDAGGNSLALAEIFDPVAETFTATGNMNVARSQHTATLLQGGKVLVAGGVDAAGNLLDSAELFDPTSGTFTLTGAMNTPRSNHTATLLQSNEVLVTGGNGETAEVFDPSSGVFTPTGSMSTGRFHHTATLLSNGTVLVAGGFKLVPSQCGDGCERSAAVSLGSTELFDPASGTFSPEASMEIDRADHTATLLGSGQVLVTGGVFARLGGRGAAISKVLASAELLQ
jgi:Putative Ig domain/Galactose oxidase, central domain